MAKTLTYRNTPFKENCEFTINLNGAELETSAKDLKSLNSIMEGIGHFLAVTMVHREVALTISRKIKDYLRTDTTITADEKKEFQRVKPQDVVIASVNSDLTNGTALISYEIKDKFYFQRTFYIDGTRKLKDSELSTGE